MKRLLLLAIVACADQADSQLVDIGVEPPGANCAAGGTAVSIGFDRNGDGVLQPDEVESVNYVCDGSDGDNGMDGDDGTQVLVETQPEPAGANCANGGVAILSGLDADEDGVLDPDEVQRTVYACTGDTGAATLVATRDEPIGTNCELGGTAILVGTDDDDDGVLDPEEVTSTSFVCNGMLANPTVVQGNFLVTNQLDIDLLAGITEVTGDLGIFISTNPPASVRLPDLQRVGQLRWSLRPDVPLELPNLLRAGNVIGAVAPFQFPLLETVDGSISLFSSSPGVSTVTEVRFPALKIVAGSMSIVVGFGAQNELGRVSAPLLQQVGGRLLIQGSQLTVVDLPMLATVNQIRITESPQLTSVSIGGISALPGGLEIFNTALPNLGNFAALETAGDINLIDTGVATIDLPSLRTATGMLRSLGRPTVIRLPQLETVGGVLELRMFELSTLEMPSIVSLGTNIQMQTPLLSKCVIEAIIAQAMYTGPRTIQAAPCP